MRKRSLLVYRNAGIVCGLSALLTIGASPVLAGNVSQSVAAGVLNASISDLALPGLTYSNSVQTSTGSMVLHADDSSGAAAGWNVTVQVSPLVYSGSYVGTSIPAANFALTSVAQPLLVSGQTVDATAATGPEIPPTSPLGTLDTPRKVIAATAAYGTGTYTQALGVTLTIPAGSKIGTYAGTMTTTIIAGA